MSSSSSIQSCNQDGGLLTSDPTKMKSEQENEQSQISNSSPESRQRRYCTPKLKKIILLSALFGAAIFAGTSTFLSGSEKGLFALEFKKRLQLQRTSLLRSGDPCYFQRTYPRRYKKGDAGQEPLSFAALQKEEFSCLSNYIEALENNDRIGKYKIIGTGVSKVAVAHDDFPHHIFKVTLQNPWNNPLDMENHVINAQHAEEVIKTYGYKHIVIPKPVLFKNDTISIVVEPKMDLIPYQQALLLVDPQQRREAEEELCHFVSETNNTDLTLKEDHNVQFVKTQTGTFKLCVYDFDRISHSLETRKTEKLNPISEKCTIL